jgi:serine/threonine protein kinase/tetratricopeptide (TPR) repeat protein
MPKQTISEQSIFLSALEKSSPDERASYLDEACAGNRQLLSDVQALLQAHDGLPGLKPASHPAGQVATLGAEQITEGPGTIIGPYKLLEQIGEGGFGLVFMAEQRQPLRRKVALKVIKPGMDTRQVVARFEAERQALALMDHPNIAGVFDGGETSTGRPYFVMELVRGQPITDYCDENNLPPRERLDLFIHVCQAVQHAHQKGIIHRDLKPSNILITLHDGTPVVKVIDFGIAKATGHQLTEKTLFTNFAQLIGTPIYMSPEQAGLSGLDVDTRSDIYSLGVLLYELLTGKTPFDRDRLREVDYDEMRRIIREEEPPKPSTRVSTMGKAGTTMAARRKSDPKRLSQLFRGELDWIVMKALDKDRSRRYETASALAADVQRYLNDEPVQACPPSPMYRFRKFARRNKGKLVVAACIALAIAGLAGAAGWIMQERAGREAKTAYEVNLVLNEVERLQKDKQWAEALALVNKADGLLANNQASDDLHERLRQARTASEQRLQQAKADREMKAELLEIQLRQAEVVDEHFNNLGADDDFGAAFRQYGIDVEKMDVAEAAARIREREITQELVAAVDQWAEVRRANRPKENGWKHLLAVAKAADGDTFRNQVREGLERRDLKGLAKMAASGNADSLPSSTIRILARALSTERTIKEAIRLLQRAQLENPGDFWINHELAMALTKMQPPQDQKAIRYFIAALAVRKSPGVYNNLSNSLGRSGAVDERIVALRQAIRLKPDFAMAHSNLGLALKKNGQEDEAKAAFAEGIRLKKELTLKKPNDARAFLDLAMTLKRQGQREEAIAAIKEAIRVKPTSAAAHNLLGIELKDKGFVGQAIAAYREAIKHDPKHAPAYYNLGVLLRADKDQLDEAITCLKTAVDLVPDRVASHNALGAALAEKGPKYLDAAIASYRTAVDLDPDSYTTYEILGNALRQKGGKYIDEAIGNLRKAIALNSGRPAAHNSLGLALRQKGLVDEAIIEYKEALRLNPKSVAFGNLMNVATAFTKQGRDDEAIAIWQEGKRLRPSDVKVRRSLAIALEQSGRVDEAIADYKEAISRKSDDAVLYVDLAIALTMKGSFDEAIVACNTALGLKADDEITHAVLGRALARSGRPDKAIIALDKAISLKGDNANTYIDLAQALEAKDRFQEALTAMRRAQELTDKGKKQDSVLAALVKESELLVELERKLPAILKGDMEPSDPAALIALARHFQHNNHLNVAAYRFFMKAFEAQPELVLDQERWHRYNAACAAALAGCGKGSDAAALDGIERASLRQKALVLLRADLKQWQDRLDKEPANVRLQVVRKMNHWKQDVDFDGMRGAGLAQLPADEQPQWQQIWDEVEALRLRAQKKS